MSNGDLPIPPTDLTSATIEAVNLILSQLGISPLDEILGLFSGKPKFDDTNAVIDAYKQSAYWPLHALAADMQIWEKNGAPISDSNPAVQASFGAAKQGTVESIQQLAGEQPGPNSPGYWTIFALIQGSWGASGYGEQQVLKYVKALDALTQVLTQENTKPPPPPPPPPPEGPPPGGGGGDNGNLIQELIACLCDDTSDECCTAVVAAITKVVQQLAIIAKALLFGGKPVGPPPPPIDLTPIVNALGELVTAVSAIGGAPAIDLGALVDAVNGVAASIAKASGTDVSGIVEQLKQANTMNDVPQAIIDAVARVGLVNPTEAQLAGGGPWAWINTLLHDEWRKLNHPPSPEEVEALKADPVFGPGASATLSGKPLPAFKELLKATPSVIGEMLLKLFQVVMEGTFDAGKTVMQPAIKQMLAIHQDAISGMVNVKPGDEANTASTLLTEAMTFGMGAHWAAYAAELVDPGKHVGLNSSAAMLAEFAGFAELVKGIIGVEVRQAIALPHTYKINSQARALMPAQGPALGMWARRKINDAQLATLLGYAGLSSDWTAPTTAAASHPVSPRALATAIQDTPFPKAEMQDILEDNGYSDAHVAFMLQVLEYNSTKNVRNAYVTEAIAAYKAGVMPDSELDDILDSVGWSDTAKQFVRSRALLQRRVTLAAEAEKSIVAEVAGGGMTADVGLQQLEAAGIEPWYAQLQITLAQTKASIHALKVEEAEARRTLLAEQRNLTKAAVAEFQRGAINLAGLTAALAAIGLDPTLVASIVAVQEATRTGRVRLLYGQLLSPQDARLLEERIAAIGQQAKDQLITLDQALAQLTQLGVDQADAHALVARWAAALKKSAGSAQLITPP